MLKIRGKAVTIDDRILVNRFGLSYRRSARLGDWIADLIEERAENRFASAAAMEREFLNRNIHSPLKLRQSFLVYDNVYIIMTGRRADDERAANCALGLRRTPDGCTWHHCENIKKTDRGWRCRMCLLLSRYHKVAHMGGVHEYELLTGIRYQ